MKRDQLYGINDVRVRHHTGEPMVDDHAVYMESPRGQHVHDMSATQLPQSVEELLAEYYDQVGDAQYESQIQRLRTDALIKLTRTCVAEVITPTQIDVFKDRLKSGDYAQNVRAVSTLF